MPEEIRPVAVQRIERGSGVTLDAQTRQRLGRQLQRMYDPVIDEALDPRLAELLQQLDADRSAQATD